MTEEENIYIGKAQAFEKILQTLLEKAPLFLDEVTKAMANEKFVRRFGTSVSIFYSSLIAQGMPEEKALELTREYIRMFNISAIVKSFENLKDVSRLFGLSGPGSN